MDISPLLALWMYTNYSMQIDYCLVDIFTTMCIIPLSNVTREAMIMNIVYWIIFGLIAGAIASFIAPGARGGILGLIVLGIVGALVGGFLGRLLFGVSVTGFDLHSFVVAVLGSLLVLFLTGRLSRTARS